MCIKATTKKTKIQPDNMNKSEPGFSIFNGIIKKMIQKKHQFLIQDFEPHHSTKTRSHHFQTSAYHVLRTTCSLE